MIRLRMTTLLVLCTLAWTGCTSLCSAEGTGGLIAFEVDCERLQFVRSTDTMNLSIFDSTDGQIDLEMPNVLTLGPGIRFGEGGDYGMSGNYHSSTVSLADLDDSWLKTTAWEGISGESYDQAVSIEFHIEVLSTSTSDGGVIDGTADEVPVF
jgi:hypothetical protein